MVGHRGALNATADHDNILGRGGGAGRRRNEGHGGGRMEQQKTQKKRQQPTPMPTREITARDRGACRKVPPVEWHRLGSSKTPS
jgi:hypothetical protein